MQTLQTQNESILKLAALTSDLSTGDEQTQSKAFKKILSMAEQGNADAMYQVARCLRHGVGVKMNEDQGDYWLRRACSTMPASVHALFVLGMQHYMHQRQDSNPELGVTMIERAADAGFSAAAVKMSSIYEDGCAFFQADLRKAYRLLASAVSVRPNADVMSAYEDFVARNRPITSLLDS